MGGSQIKILLLEDNPADADLLQELILEIADPCWQIVHVELLSDALHELRQQSFDVVLSDLSLPDAHGLETVVQIHALMPGLPIVVLTGLTDEAVGLEALRQGAQDYLPKNAMSYHLLTRTIHYAIERERTQQVMRQQSAAMDACAEGIAIVNAAYEYTYLNQAYASIYGYDSPADLIGRSRLLLHDRAETEQLQQTVLPALQTHGYWRGETIGIRRDSSTLYLDLSVTVLPDGGFICTIRDITNRKQIEQALRLSEARFQTLVANVPSVIYRYVLSPNGAESFAYISPRCYDLCELEAEAVQADPQLFWQLIHPEQMPRLRDAIMTSARTLQPKSVEVQITTPSGRLKWVLANSHPELQANGDIVWDGIMTDISDRKHAEVEVNRALAREQDLNKLKSHFVAMVSHEFRTPMTTIRTSSELLEHYYQQSTAEKRQEYFDRINKAIMRMLKLLDEVLLLGKAEAGGLRFEPTNMDLRQFCQDITYTFQLIAGDFYQIVFYSEMARTIVQMDEVLLTHIFSNLLSNAIKYSPDGGTIEFRLSQHDHYAIFQVKDAGIGIPPSDQKHLFEGFRRARNVGRIQGTGLGLAIVKNCVELHHGHISLESTIGIGTTFTVHLPMHP